MVARADRPSLMIEHETRAAVLVTLHLRGPLGRPPWPSTACIMEASRIETSLGPAKKDISGRVWERTEKCVLTYSYDIAITIVQALVV